MNEKSLQEILNPEPAITVSRSMVNKGKLAKKGHHFFTVKHKNIFGSTLTLTQEFKTEGLDPISELALKGNLVKQFREHFKI